MEALRLQEAQPHNDNVIVHVLTMPKRKRIKVPSIQLRRTDRWIIRGEGFVFDNSSINWKHPVPLEGTFFYENVIDSHRKFGEELKQKVLQCYPKRSDRFLSKEESDKYFYKHLKTSAVYIRKALA